MVGRDSGKGWWEGMVGRGGRKGWWEGVEERVVVFGDGLFLDTGRS